jgi:hypothetical protein
MADMNITKLCPRCNQPIILATECELEAEAVEKLAMVIVCDHCAAKSAPDRRRRVTPTASREATTIARLPYKD